MMRNACWIVLVSVLAVGSPMVAHAATVSLVAVPANGSVTLSWTVGNGAIDNQEIYQDTDNNPTGRVRIATVSASARSFTVTGLTNNTTYFFWIKARQTSDGATVNSGAASARPNPSSFWALSGNLGTHDPTLIEENGVWYEFQTGSGIFGKVSRDGGFTWNPLPSLLPNGLSWWKTVVPNQNGIDVWAPDVKVFNGRTWLYYAISTFGSKVSAIGLLSASSVAAGDWRDEGMIIRTTDSNDYNAIDPDLVIDASGKPWLVFGSWNSGIKLAQLDSNMKITGSLKSLAAKDGGIEAPNIVLRSGRYYLFVSTGLCCQGVNSTYQIRVGRSSSITGPYLDKDGVDMMKGGGTLFDGGNSRWIGPGGQDLYGTGVLVRHAYDANDNGNPKLLINTLSWTSDGWPTY